MTDHIDEVEGKQGMRDMAVMTRAYYDGLREQGFGNADALRLTAAWITGVVSASQGKSDG